MNNNKRIWRTDLRAFEVTELLEKSFEHEGHKDTVIYYVNNFGVMMPYQVKRVGSNGKGVLIFSKDKNPEILAEYRKILNTAE